MRVLSRILFALRHKTLAKIAVSSGDASKIVICHKGGVTELPRRCPHQGAPLEKGYFDGDDLICPWHGCRFKLRLKAGDAKNTLDG